jgi:hypothetical protein
MTAQETCTITLGTPPARVGDDPDEPGKNADRAAWALVALNAFIQETGVDPEDAIPDLLANLMHLVDRAALPNGDRLHPEGFRDLLDQARSNYEYEVTA